MSAFSVKIFRTGGLLSFFMMSLLFLFFLCSTLLGLFPFLVLIMCGVHLLLHCLCCIGMVGLWLVFCMSVGWISELWEVSVFHCLLCPAICNSTEWYLLECSLSAVVDCFNWSVNWFVSIAVIEYLCISSFIVYCIFLLVIVIAAGSCIMMNVYPASKMSAGLDNGVVIPSGIVLVVICMLLIVFIA